MKKQLVSSLLFCTSALTMVACNADTSPATTAASNQKQQQNASVATAQQTFKTQAVSHFNEPWALAQLPDGRLLVTERAGNLVIFNPTTGEKLNVKGVPKVQYGGQGGLGDVILHPQFAQNHWVYLSYAEAGRGGQGAVVVRANLDLSQPQQPSLTQLKTIWQQTPKVSGQGHYGHRLAFDQHGKLWISSGERQKFTPAQDMNSNLGKILRLNDDGTPASGNPFAARGGVAAQVWSLGHRNPLGMAFDSNGQLWVIEMGPKGGDELNRIVKGENYGYPTVSNGDHYSGRAIPRHATRPEFKAPEVSWTPVISPASLLIYQGNQFPQWKGKALIGGLSSEAIVVVDLTAKPIREVQRVNMKQRIRGLIEAKDGSIWVIEDGENARLLRLTK